MLAAIKGYYDGNQIIVREKDRKNLSIGDEVIITILDNAARQGPEKKVVILFNELFFCLSFETPLCYSGG